jgi:hypothetical protein
VSTLSTSLAQREASLPALRVRALLRAIRAAVRRPEAISGDTQPRLRWP